MKICVVGAGAIGGILAFRLAAAGHDVSVVARGAHRAAIAERGLTMVDHLDGGRAGNVRTSARATARAMVIVLVGSLVLVVVMAVWA